MVGSSARATCVELLSVLLSTGASGLATSGGGGFRGGGDVSATGGGGLMGGSGGGLGGGSVATGPDVDGRLPPAPGMKEKSSASDDEIHGTCSWREARVMPTRVRLSVSSAIRSGKRISFNSSCTNRLWSLPLSESSHDSAADFITSVPFGAITGASPADKLRN